jgi:hypothetical protein
VEQPGSQPEVGSDAAADTGGNSTSAEIANLFFSFVSTTLSSKCRSRCRPASTAAAINNEISVQPSRSSVMPIEAGRCRNTKLKNLLTSAECSIHEPGGSSVLRHLDASVRPGALDHGASIDLANNDGVTPLRQTLLSKPFSLDATELLLARGADPEAKMKNGKTVREFAHLVSYGADKAIGDLFEKYNTAAAG